MENNVEVEWMGKFRKKQIRLDMECFVFHLFTPFFPFFAEKQSRLDHLSASMSLVLTGACHLDFLLHLSRLCALSTIIDVWDIFF